MQYCCPRLQVVLSAGTIWIDVFISGHSGTNVLYISWIFSISAEDIVESPISRNKLNDFLVKYHFTKTSHTNTVC